ncbi:MAG: adenylate/guanylate cyclase domain-containing protein [Chloroflexota bacterium]|nr:adenylate/guanylate cyclase domain-containing protein [Chloroflexota bacterium]
MTAPQIRYVRSADGTRIATMSAGTGPPLVWVPSPFSPIDAQLQVPEYRAQLEFFAERFRYITYDPRGRGLSDRDVNDWSLDARVADLHAVLEGLSLSPAYVMALGFGGMIALAATARRPRLVRRLGLLGGIIRGRDFRFTVAGRAIGGVMEADWPLYCQCSSLITFGWSESGRILADSLSKAFTPDAFAATVRAFQRDDVSEYLARVASPVFLVHPTHDEQISPDVMREMAAKLKDARIRISSTTRWWSSAIDADDLRAFVEFFAEDDAAPNDGQPLPSGMAVILFTDIVDSTALTERLGDTVFRTASRTLDEAMRAAMRDAGGTPVEGKVLGDGVMGVFTSASQAIVAARRCIELSAESELRLHVGLHAGDVTHEAGNVYGGAVNIASRICGLSAPGEILVSATVRDLARTSAGVAFADRGEHALKGVGDPVRVYAVRWRP